MKKRIHGHRQGNGDGGEEREGRGVRGYKSD